MPDTKNKLHDIRAMYLDAQDWSPRFGETFFTIKMGSFELLESQSEGTVSFGGKTSFPAFYYCIEVYCGKAKHLVWRRYSDFAWLYRRIRSLFPEKALSLPPGTCFCHNQSLQFAENRACQLREFMQDCLLIPNLSSQHEVLEFLELGVFQHG